jgi:hypothetical protein
MHDATTQTVQSRSYSGEPALALKAMNILDDPDREFVSSVFLQLETLPKAVYYKNRNEISFYEAFFNAVKEWALPSDVIIQEAYQEACKLGLSAMDALHIAAAIAVRADELVTTERPEKPIHRVTTLKVVSLHSTLGSGL